MPPRGPDETAILTIDSEVDAVLQRPHFSDRYKKPLLVYLRESGQDPELSGRYGRM